MNAHASNLNGNVSTETEELNYIVIRAFKCVFSQLTKFSVFYNCDNFIFHFMHLSPTKNFHFPFSHKKHHTIKTKNYNATLNANHKSKSNDDNNNNFVIFDIVDSNKKTSTHSLSMSETDSSLSSSDKENDTSSISSTSSNYGSIKTDYLKPFNDGFQYKTINGRIIRSVTAPGKGIKVDYKVNVLCLSGFCLSSIT